MSRTFTSIYKEFVAAKAARNYDEMLKIVVAYDCQTIVAKWIEHHVFMIRATFDNLNKYTNPPSADDAAKLLRLCETVIGESAKHETFQQFLSALNKSMVGDAVYAAYPSLKLLAGANTDVRQCMRSINDHLVSASTRVTPVTDAKELFMAMTHAAQFFFKMETELKADYSETKRYLKFCEKYDFTCKYATCFVACFAIMAKYVDAWDKFDAIKWQRTTKEIKDFLNTAPKLLRATAVQDIAVTLAGLILITQSKVSKQLDATGIDGFFDVLLRLMEILRHTKYEKVICSQCKSNAGPHSAYNITVVALEVFKNAIGKPNGLNALACKVFGKMFAINLVTISKLECVWTDWTQQKSIKEVASVVTLCSSEDKVNCVMPMFAAILESIGQINLTKVVPAVNEMFFLRKMFDMVNKAEMWTECIQIGYLILTWTCVMDEPNIQVLNFVIHAVSRKQFECKSTIPFESPYDFHLKLSKNGMTQFGLKLPTDLPVVEMLLHYLRINGLYGTRDLDEFNNKCIYQLVMQHNKTDSTRCMRFIYLNEHFNWDAISERCDRQLKEWRTRIGSYDEQRQRAVSLLIGAFDLHIYEYRLAQSVTKYSSLRLLSAFTSDDPSNVFSEHTLASEREHVELLFSAATRFESFLEFYLKLDENDRKTYADEAKYLARAFKKLGQHLLYRDYESDALRAYVASYRLAKVFNDQFEMIAACGYFAKRSRIFRSHFEHQHNWKLSDILDECYEHLMQNIQNIEALSVRKQKEIFYCLQNIALYHFDDGRIDHGKRVLQFVKKQMDEYPNQNALVGLNYHCVLFTMVTKYQQTSLFSAVDFADKMINKIRNDIMKVNDDTCILSTILFETVPALVTFCLNRYETSSAMCENLLLTVLKFALRSGYVRRSIALLILLGKFDLYQEKWESCEKRLGLLEQMCLSNESKESRKLCKSISAMDDGTVNNAIDSSDPIRRDASTSHRSLSPYKVVKNGVESHMCRYLLTSHGKKCSCDICYSPYNRFLLFEIGALYARIVYFNDSNAETKQSIHTEIYEHWTHRLRPLELNDISVTELARTLMWCAHAQWKFELDRRQVKIVLNESIEQLRRVQHYDRAMEHDLLAQIELLQRELGATAAKPVILNQKKNFAQNVSPLKKTKKQPAAAAVAAAATTPSINIFNANGAPVRPKPITFQIHDDESPHTEVCKTRVKKVASAKKKDVKIELKVTNSIPAPMEKSPKNVEPQAKALSRTNRIRCEPTDNIDEGVKATKTTRTRTEKVKTENKPIVTRPQRAKRV